MKTFAVNVTQLITVEVDETKFTPEFMAEFNEHMFEANLRGHVEYIAGSMNAGIITSSISFLEGYGPLNEFGISVKKIGVPEFETEEVEQINT